MRQRLIVDRRLHFWTWEQDTGDTARVEAGYVNPMATAGSAPDFVCRGRCAFALLRTEEGRRLGEVVVREKWRRLPERRAAPVVD